MKNKTLFLYLFLVFLCHESHAQDETLPPTEHHCVWYGECFFRNGFWLNCNYTGPAKQLFNDEITLAEEDTLIDILERRCPHFLHDSEGNRLPNELVRTCCSKEQLVGLDDSTRLADGVLGRCPSCLRNYIRGICDMSCAGDQSRFIDTYTVDPPDEDIEEYIVEIDFRMHVDQMEGVFASCQEVMMPQMGIPAVSVMCGGAAICNAQSWYDYAGDLEENQFTPFQINYISTEDESISYSAPRNDCNEAPEGSIACSCMDCSASCPIGTEPTVAEPSCRVLSVNCVSFSIGITVFVLSVTLFSILTIIDYTKSRSTEIINNNKNDVDITKQLSISSLNQFYKHAFERIGVFSSSSPMLLIMLSSWLIVGLTYGAFSLIITSNPIEIWSSETSQTREELNYFNTRFGPFYRASQIFLQINLEPFVYETDNAYIEYGPAYRIEAIKELAILSKLIKDIGRADGGVTMEEICYAPLLSHGDDGRIELCTITSILTYFGDNADNVIENTYLNTIQNCLNNYFNPICLASWGGGSDPNLAFGGFSDDVQLADTLVLTIPINNHLREEDLKPAMEWEQKFLDIMHDYEVNWKSDFIDVSYGAERSIEDELIRTSKAEILPISISYLLMFVYVTFGLGKLKSWRTLLVDSKIVVAVSSIVIVLMSIVCALGVMGYVGIPTTLIAINVIPFFILSVGVDNIFIMVNKLDKVSENLKNYAEYSDGMTFSKKKSLIFGKMLGQAGPSILLTTASQLICFGIGTLSNSPAVNTFAIFASIALGFLFLFQMTACIAIMALDFKRSYMKRLDLFCCIRMKFLDDQDPLTDGKPHVGLVQRAIVPYSRILLKWPTKIVVIILFAAWAALSITFIPHIEVGLEQEMALPYDSYARKYLISVSHLMQMGPPVFFVVTSGLNFTIPEHQNTICGGQMCNSDSLTTQVFLASQHSDVTYITQSSNSWLDDFFDWTSLKESCCKENITDGSFCQSFDNSPECEWCSIEMEQFDVRPLTEGFRHHLPNFLKDTPTESCSKGGLASYSAAINFVLDDSALATVHDSHFMAFHKSLTTSKDYFEALRYARQISDNITAMIHEKTGVEEVRVFPYSVFYAFYEQYLTMWEETIAALGYSMLALLVVVVLLTGFNLVSVFAIMTSVVMILIDMMGLMYLWNVPLNPVSLVNLIISIGIGVEFSSHTVYAYVASEKSARDKAHDSLVSMGTNIINGITLTNIPIIVFAFSITELIETFFFRMFFGTVVIGFLHGIVFLPVLLSFLGNLASYKR